jgi:hypothetical protein
MSNSPPHACADMEHTLAEADYPLIYYDKFREYGIRILDGGSSFVLINFCPFCGIALPPSLRDEWFARLDKLGIEPEDPHVPPEMKSGTWWRQNAELVWTEPRDQVQTMTRNTSSRRLLL